MEQNGSTAHRPDKTGEVARYLHRLSEIRQTRIVRRSTYNSGMNEARPYIVILLDNRGVAHTYKPIEGHTTKLGLLLYVLERYDISLLATCTQPRLS